MPMVTNIWLGLKAFIVFRLLKSKTLEMLSMGERRKSKLKFGGIKVWKVEEAKKYFASPKIEKEVFGWCLNYIIGSLDFRNILWTLFLLHMKIWMVSFHSTYWLSSTYFILLRVFRFFLFLSFFLFFCGFLLRYWDKFSDTLRYSHANW